MKRISLLVFCLFLGPGIGGCRYFHMSSVKIVEWSPREDLLPGPEEPVISFTFSASMDRTSVEEAFSLELGGESLPGRFLWEGMGKGDRMTFLPLEKLLPRRNYTLGVQRSAEDIRGNDLSSDFIHIFSTTDDEQRPCIVSFLPGDGETSDDLLQPLIFRFSEPVLRGSFYEAFDLSPGVSGIFRWEDSDSSVRFLPLEKMISQRRYFIRLDSDVSDLSGNKMAEPFSASFFLGSESESPAVEAAGNDELSYFLQRDDPDDGQMYINSSWERMWNIKIVFSEKISREELEKGADLEPSLDFSLGEPADEYADTFLLVFQERPRYGEVYTLTLSEEISDESGNRMKSPEIYHFRVDGKHSLPPAVTRVTFLADPQEGTEKISEYGSYDPLLLDRYSPHVPEETDGFFDLYFTLAEEAEIDLPRFIENFSITPEGNCAEITPIGIEPDPLGGVPPSPLPGSDESLLRVHVRVEDFTETGVVILRLEAEFADTLENPMGEDWIFYLNETTP